MASAADLAIILSGKDVSAGKTLASIENAMGGFARAAALAGAAVAAAFAAAGVASVKLAGDLEQSVAAISTIKPEIDTSGVFNALNEMSTRVPQTAAQLGDALYNVFSSVDVSQQDAVALVEKFAKGAVGAQTDAQTFGTAVMGVMNAYKLSVEDADHVSDVFFNTVNRGVVTGGELASNLGLVTQSAKAAGVGIDELGALIAGVTKEGGPAAQNINNLSNLFMKITTKEAVADLNKLGVATSDSAGNIRPILDVLGDLRERLGGMSEAAKAMALQDIFPDAQARAGAQTIISQLDFVNEALAENIDSSGSAARAYRTMSETFNSQTKLLGNTFQSLLTTVGAKLLPVITPLITQLAKDLPAAFDRVMAAMAPVASFIGTNVLPVLERLGAVLRSVFAGEFAGAFSGLQDVVSDVGPKLAAQVQEWGQAFIDWIGPLIPPLLAELERLAIALLEWAVQQVPVVIEALATWAAAFLEWIAPMIPPFLAELGRLADGLFQWVVAQIPVIADQLAKWVDAFLPWVEDAIRALLPELAKVHEALIAWITDQAPVLAEKFLSEWVPAALVWVAQTAIEIAPKLAELLIAINTWVITKGVPGVLEMFLKLGEAIVTGTIKGLYNLGAALDRAIGEELDKVRVDIGFIHFTARRGFWVDAPSITLPPISAPAMPSPTGIPGMAAGGPVAAGSAYLVGERGPELFVPRQSGTVVPNGGSSQSTVLNFHFPGGESVSLRALAANPDDVAYLGRVLTRYQTYQRERGA